MCSERVEWVCRGTNSKLRPGDLIVSVGYAECVAASQRVAIA